MLCNSISYEDPKPRFVALCLIVMACDDDSETSEYPDLRIYLDRFQQEAMDRGYDFDLSNVEATYVDNIVVNNQTYCGYGYSNYDGAGKRRIEISSAGGCGWSNLSDLERENFVFHEIGTLFSTADMTTNCYVTVQSLHS